MNRDGAEKISEVLSGFMSNRIGLADVPREDQDLRYFNVFDIGYDDGTHNGEYLAAILRKFDDADLLLHGDEKPDPNADRPQLRHMASVGIMHTFEDLSAK